jgi:hypothetical protein
MDAPAMEREDARWNMKMHDGMQRCMVKCEDARWNVKMCENAKMHGEMQRSTMECEDARAQECIARVWESVLSLACYCREAAYNMWNRSTHDGDVVL